MSPLFRAALELLAGADHSVVLLKLADHFPGHSLAQVDAVLRETAVTFHAQAVTP